MRGISFFGYILPCDGHKKPSGTHTKKILRKRNVPKLPDFEGKNILKLPYLDDKFEHVTKRSRILKLLYFPL